MNEPQHRMIALTGGEVHVLDWGGGGPAVHFAHANGFNGATYAPILAPLAGEARLLASDLRGHGFTTLPADPQAHPGWPVFAADLAVRAFLGWARLFPMAAPTGGMLTIGGWVVLAAAALARPRT